MRPSLYRGRTLLVDMPIGARLTLGFILAALIAAVVAGAVGFQRAQSLNRQSDFYQSLLRTNTSLTTGESFLQLMDTETHVTLDLVKTPNPSQETLKSDQNAVSSLSTRYNTLLTSYIANDLVEKHTDQVALLAEANHDAQVKQQNTLAASALRTWQLYRVAQAKVLQQISVNNLTEAQRLEQVQGEPTHADATSALRSLVQFDQRLATSVQDAASVEEQGQLVMTVIGSILAFLCIVLVGWLISSTIVQRLRQLRRVLQKVEQGELSRRVLVVGRDEISDVSSSVNAMLDALVTLLEESRNQRDALTNAAEHLFTDMRVVSAGDLRINAPVSNDPIGMLANAFNFTVGRFRRFVLRTRITIEQLDVLSHQGLERSEAFIQTQGKRNAPSPARATSLTPAPSSNDRTITEDLVERQGGLDNERSELLGQVRQVREHVQRLSEEGFTRHMRTLQVLIEQIAAASTRLTRAMQPGAELSANNVGVGGLVPRSTLQLQIQELRMLEVLLQRLNSELRSTQKSTLQGFQELEAELTQVATALQIFKSKSTPTDTADASGIDSTRFNMYVKEMVMMTRQVAALAQEMYASIVSFQLDAMEHADNPASDPFGKTSVGPSTPAQQRRSMPLSVDERQ